MPVESADDDLEALANARLDCALSRSGYQIPAHPNSPKRHTAKQPYSIAAADDAAQDQAWVDDISQFNDNDG